MRSLNFVDKCIKYFNSHSWDYLPCFPFICLIFLLTIFVILGCFQKNRTFKITTLKKFKKIYRKIEKFKKIKEFKNPLKFQLQRKQGKEPPRSSLKKLIKLQYYNGLDFNTQQQNEKLEIPIKKQVFYFLFFVSPASIFKNGTNRIFFYKKRRRGKNNSLMSCEAYNIYFPLSFFVHLSRVLRLIQKVVKYLILCDIFSI